MSTLSTPRRLLSLAAPVGIALTLGVGLAGCSSMSSGRTGSASKTKTFLSVGDKPLPVVSGEPGSTVAADDAVESPLPRRKARPEGRISGRVFDADGQPLPGARVRLAVSGAPGGKVVAATSDRSGAFTLHNLRPGSSYTVIAEYEGDDGVLTGRANARAADTDVRISLAADDAPKARAADSSRIDRVSDREPADEDEPAPAPARRKRVRGADAADPVEERPAGRRVNEEDLPPAAEAEAMAPSAETETPTRAATSTRRLSARPGQVDAWKSGPRTPRKSPRTEPAAEDDAGPAPRGAATPPVEAETPDGDVPNPLPPAIEPGREQAASAPARPADPDPFAEEPPRVATRDPFTNPSTTRPPAASSPFEAAARPTAAPAAAAPAVDSAPGALVVEPGTFSPVVVKDSDPFATAAPAPASDPFAEPRPAPRPATGAARPSLFSTRPHRPRRPPVATPSAALAGSSSEADRPTPTGRRRPTWADLASTSPAPPLDGATAADAKAKADAGIARRSLNGRGDDTVAPARLASAATPDPSAPSCEYDDRHRRIIDFRLPDLDGKPLRFRDLDADLVLIDFWGTWCPPCLRSIPHLVDLQQRLGAQRLAVVGVACEPDAPDKAAPRVAEAARKLQVNYPVLLSRNDGSCPLQEALHVQAFPTMVLVDREGRVLWRDQGATPATLARLDRMLSSAAGSDPAPTLVR